MPAEFLKQTPKLTPASGEVFIVERNSWKGKTDCKKVHMFVREGDSIICGGQVRIKRCERERS